ncbi:MAG: BTAD domain-containing putative transcriptional regulator, partial [Kibdelosporangium sp.]
MEFRLLGPLEVRRDGEALELGGPRQRAVLAALAIRANKVVGVDYLASAAWQRPPPSLQSNVRTYIATLRRLLAEPANDRLVRTPDGYRLVAAGDEVDHVVFEDLASRAGQALRQGDVPAAADLAARALGIWRGVPFAGLPVGPALETEIARLAERRLNVVELRIETRLLLGEHDEVTAELQGLVAEHPFREKLAEQLMQALHQAGRQAEALEVYQRTRQRLVAELGVEPGPRLRDLQQRVLSGTGKGLSRVAAAVPAELPAAVSAFTGREDQLARLDRMLERLADTVAVAAISGGAGVGKTALAVHWAHRVAGRFPDGQAFVDLGGYGPDRPSTATEVLGRLLGGMGMPSERIPTELDAMVALYRSQLAGRRILIVLDNARTAEQVRPPLPGRPGCVVVVTSRDTLAGLAALDGAYPVTVQPLTPDESATLLGRILDDDRVRTERAAVAELARRCGHLPLALRLAAARLSTQPQHSVRALLSWIRQRDRLSALQVPGDPLAAVRVAFDHSYFALDPQSRQLFRRLALAPGPSLSCHVAAALMDTTVDAAELLLDVLTSASMVEQPEPGRYRLHDLLRHYAAEKTKTDETEADQDAAIRRVLEWYRCTAADATAVLDPHRRRTVEFALGTPNRWPVGFSGYDDALAWCEAERANLMAAVRHAADHGVVHLAWQLPIVLFGFLELRRYWSDWIATHRIGLAAARQAGAREAEAWMLNSLGIAYKQTGKADQAQDCYRQALEIRESIGDLHGQAVTLLNIGAAANHTGRHQEAIEIYRAALAIFRQTADRWGEGLSLSNLGDAHRKLGVFDVAVECFEDALPIRRELADRRGEGIVLHNLAETFRAAGRAGDAVGHYRTALAIRTAVGDRWGVARTCTGLGHALAAVGEPAMATGYWHRAMSIFRELGDPQADEVASHLGRISDQLLHASVVAPRRAP